MCATRRNPSAAAWIRRAHGSMVHAGPVSDVLPDELLDLAIEIAREVAGRLRTEVRHDHRNIETKSSITDMVTATDRAVEELIRTRLLAARPDDGFIGEEGADRVGTSGVTWIVDPIDGTTNFVYGLRGFNTSIAAQLDGVTIAGVVVDPLLDEYFTATIGGGAHCNGDRISCSTQTDLALSLVATGFSYDPARRTAQAEVVSSLIGEVRDIRRLGAAALDLCMVAAGRVDAYFESGLKVWDRAAGELIAREAGALVGGIDGSEPSETFMLAAPPGLFRPLQQRLHGLNAAG